MTVHALKTTSSISPVSNAFVLSDEQIAIAAFVAEGKGNIVVQARAGTGKTTLILKCIPLMNGKVAVTSFSNKIVKEIQTKANAAGLDATIKTMHGFGYAAMQRVFKNTVLEKRQGDKFNQIAGTLAIPQYLLSFVKSAMSKAMQRGFGIDGMTHMADKAAWLNLVDHFDLSLEIADDHLEIAANLKRISVENARQLAVEEGCRFAAKAILEGIKILPEVISFDDMLYAPLRLNMKFEQFNWVCVDEAQDSNETRREIARRMTVPGGRRVWVGDDCQSIMGFAGASSDSMAQIVAIDNATSFPMTLTRRCSKAVVELAREIVPDYRTVSNQHEGSVSYISEQDFATRDLIPGRDAIICRNMRPLIEIAYGLIKRGIPAHIEGKEIGKDLISLISRWKIKTLVALTNKLEDYREKQVAKLLLAKKEISAESVNDRIDAVMALISGMPVDSLVSDLKQKIESMFSDTPEGERPATVSLMTAHKSKGLEFDVVYGWGVKQLMPSKYATQAWQMQQEENLRYVLYTRAKIDYIDVSITIKTPNFGGNVIQIRRS